MQFDKEQLLLSPGKAAQLTAALATLGVAEPLQQLCDEAVADVQRMVQGYVIADEALNSFVRGLALYRAYGYAGPVPADVLTDYQAAYKELEAIAKGERPNLPRVTGPNSAAGKWGSVGQIKMRTDQG